jgi:hypothetical protein
MAMLWMWGCGRPCGLVWCSKEEITHRCGLAGEKRVRPDSCMSSRTWLFADQACDHRGLGLGR